MHYFVFPEIDTTIYQATGSSNAGKDEILEVQKTMSTSGGNVKVSRILIKFDLGDIQSSINNGTISSDRKFYLNMYDAGSEALKVSQSLWAYLPTKLHLKNLIPNLKRLTHAVILFQH